MSWNCLLRGVEFIGGGLSICCTEWAWELVEAWFVAGGGTLLWIDVGSVVAGGGVWWSARRSSTNWSLLRISGGRLEDVNPTLGPSPNVALLGVLSMPGW